MSSYRIGIVNFEFWDGPPPAVPTQKVRASHRSGVSGVAHHLLGRWGDPVEVVTTSHWATQLDASVGYNVIRNMIGTTQAIMYNNLNWSGIWGTVYMIQDVQIVESRSVLFLMGPGYVHYNGTSLQTRITMTPQEL